MNIDRLEDLVSQALEHAMGAVKVYAAALSCVRNEALRVEWERAREEARRRVSLLSRLCAAVGFDPDRDSASRQLVATAAASTVEMMKRSSSADDRVSVELAACENIVLVETTTRAQLRILNTCAAHVAGPHAETLQAACEELGDRAESNLSCSEGWRRELWLEALGLGGKLPPPERRAEDARSASPADEQ